MSNWDEAYEAMQFRVDDAIAEKGGKFRLMGRRVIYSAYQIEADDMILDNTDVVIPGRVVFFCKHEPFWGEGRDYFSEELTNPTYLDAAVCANDMIHTTGDYHHVFFEGVRPAYSNDGVDYYELVMGS